MALGSYLAGCASVPTTHSATPVEDERVSVRTLMVGTDGVAIPLPGVRGGYRFPVGDRADVGFGVGTHGLDADFNLALVETPHFAASISPTLAQGFWLWRDGIHGFSRARLGAAVDVVKVGDSSVTLSGSTGAVGVTVSDRRGPTARGVYFEGANAALNVEVAVADDVYLVGGVDGNFPMGRPIEPLTVGARAWTPRQFKWVANLGVDFTVGE